MSFQGIRVVSVHFRELSYIKKIPKKFSKDENKTIKTSIDINVYMSKNKGKGINQLEYPRIIGSHQYVMNCISPDIANSISKLSRFISNSSMDMQKAKKKVVEYLRYILDYWLYYIGYLVVLERYNGSNWICNTNDSKYTSEYVFTLGRVVVSWKSFKQICIARSTMELEFIVRNEAEWIQNFL